MSYLDRDEETIFALSTPPGRGGIAVIRVSGPEAFLFCKKNCSFLPETPDSHHAYFGKFKSSQKEIIDEVLVTYFAEGRSFTGQESLEISCHGSPILVSSISEELLASGCRLAERGEFTYRAFMNGKMDLVQAESVLSLIESKSKTAARLASRQLQGDLSKALLAIEDNLTWILANMEAAIDFSTEDIEPYNSEQLFSLAKTTLGSTEALLSSHTKGRIISEGLQIALVGRPNAGKSSLLNALVQKDQAIVTDVAGTTRDLIHAQMSVEGVNVCLTDTAGLRETQDQIEQIGIQKTLEAISSADVVFYILDLSKEFSTEDKVWIENLVNKVKIDDSAKPLILVGNKIDIGEMDLELTSPHFDQFTSLIKISTVTRYGLDNLMEIIREKVTDLMAEDTPLVQNTRHVEKLELIKASIEKTLSLLSNEDSPEFISFELQCGLKATKEILGKTYDDEVMDRVFQEFCIGK